MVTLMRQLLAHQDYLGFTVRDVTELGGKATTAEDARNLHTTLGVTMVPRAGTEDVTRIIVADVIPRGHPLVTVARTITSH